ncbi:MAG TPA: Vms1/Ankzf1 family peptidyl-tRNA hydrolase [Nocardioidaceae bacterium]|nr:Vms1/Ankzf1 family peptidyl-tRNA hydrolase [Nocardioidaceae bacterium]
MSVLQHRITHSTLEVVLRPAEPVAAVYLGAAPDVANEYQLAWETRWKPLAARLREQGADEATIHVLETAVSAPATARAARGSGQVAGYSRGGEVLAVVPLPGLAGPDMARYGAPAHMLPVLTWAQERPAFVLVVIDRAGADIAASIGGGSDPVHSEVEGPDDEIERNAPGGWEGLTQGRYQRRAEDSWAHNAGAVAEAAAAALQRVEGKILVLSGDVRAQQFLLEKLPEWVHQTVTVKRINGSRHADGSHKVRDELVARAVDEATADDLRQLWDTFAEQRSPNGMAVEGAHDTLAALAAGRVATLLIKGDEGMRAWFNSSPTDIAPADEDAPVSPGARVGPLVDVAVRAALLTGAQVRVIPPDAGFGPSQGVGGICRFR